ncbi:MAG: EAL domain-containing protein [Alphaproteobacteria bacterium]|nr:EAL domain-containing protein [Alphaproteobacteria bacterium]
MPETDRSFARLMPLAIKALAIFLMAAIPLLLILNLYLGRQSANLLPMLSSVQPELDGLFNRQFTLTLVTALASVLASFLLWHQASRRQRSEELSSDQLMKLQRNALVAANSTVMVAITGKDGKVEWINAAFAQATGYQIAEARGRDLIGMLNCPRGEQKTVALLREAVETGSNIKHEVLACNRDGNEYWAEISLQPTLRREGELDGFVAMLHDISTRKMQQQQLERVAYYDSQTGFANRALLLRRLREVLQSGTSRPSLIHIKFPRATIMRSALSQDMGEELTLAITARLREALTEEQLPVRLSGSAFAVMAPVKRPAEAMTIAYTIQSALAKPYRIADREVHLIASIGVAVADAEAMGAEDADYGGMLRDAEIAAHSVTTKNMDEVVLYDITMRQRLEERARVESDLRRAIYFDTTQMHCAFQPILDLETLQLRGFETLARWNHPERGWIPPDKFIAIAEDTGLIVPLWNYVFSESCRNLMKWQRMRPANLHPLFISVNLSATQFTYPGLIRAASNVIEMSRINPAWIKFEITESGLMENAEAALAQMESIKALGCTLAIDDFGTGYSSLSYLQKLPVDDIKIDRSFIMSMHKAPENRELVRIITEIGRILGKKVIAEGIETEQDLIALRHLKCDMGQGYYFHKPLFAEDAEKLVAGTTAGAIKPGALKA